MSNIIKRIELRNKEREYYAQLFREAGFQHIAMNETRNRYHGDGDADIGPWFLVATEKGFYVIGWRKRVIHIEWGGIKTPDGLFADQGNITRGLQYIHAWGQAKAVEYLSKLRTCSELEAEELERYTYRAEVEAKIDALRAEFQDVMDAWERKIKDWL